MQGQVSPGVDGSEIRGGVTTVGRKPPFGCKKKPWGCQKSLVNNGDKHYQYLPTSTGGKISKFHQFPYHILLENFRTSNRDLEENAKK